MRRSTVLSLPVKLVFRVADPSNLPARLFSNLKLPKKRGAFFFSLSSFMNIFTAKFLKRATCLEWLSCLTMWSYVINIASLPTHKYIHSYIHRYTPHTHTHTPTPTHPHPHKHTHTHSYIYIYAYRERDREREIIFSLASVKIPFDILKKVLTEKLFIGLLVDIFVTLCPSN